MLYKRRVIKELGIYAIGIFFILLAVLSAIQLVNILGKVAKGYIQLDLFVPVMGVAVMGLMPLILGITCFMSILAVFTGYWRHNEMTVWLASGLALRRWLIPVLWFCIPFFLISLLLSLVLIPQTSRQGFEYSNFVQQKPTLSFIDQGVFAPITDGVIFVNTYNPGSGVLTAFFSHEADPKTGKFKVTLAENGRVELEEGKVKITLSGATRYLGFPDRSDFSIFKIPEIVYTVKDNIPPAVSDENHVNGNILPTAQLWQSSSSRLQSVLMWRLSLPLSIIILSLWALSLSYLNPRSNKNYNIIYAILVFFAYQNLQIIARNLIYKGTLGFWDGLIIPHALMLLGAVIFLYYRSVPKSNILTRIYRRFSV